jgi:cold shock CspA family protein
MDQKMYFVHRSAVEAAGLDDLQDNQKIEFKIVANQGKESAEDIVLV